jgi:hypothetical protein
MVVLSPLALVVPMERSLSTPPPKSLMVSVRLPSALSTVTSVCTWSNVPLPVVLR